MCTCGFVILVILFGAAAGGTAQSGDAVCAEFEEARNGFREMMVSARFR